MCVILFQVVQLCQVLQNAPHVQVLHLPHLACGLDGLKAVAQIVENSPLVSLNLAGSLSSGTPVSVKGLLLSDPILIMFKVSNNYFLRIVPTLVKDII